MGYDVEPPEVKAALLANLISVCLCVFMVENDIFRALADPTRRAIFEKLAVGAMNASALREGMAISQPAMSQHLAVLRGARLVREERRGRFVNYEVDPEGLARIAQWLAKYRAYWPARVEALKVLLKDMDS
jgi:DNA-binding transcriptional ArsR family regulator